MNIAKIKQYQVGQVVAYDNKDYGKIIKTIPNPMDSSKAQFYIIETGSSALLVTPDQLTQTIDKNAITVHHDDIYIFEQHIDTSKILDQLKKYNSDWGHQNNLANVESMLNYGFPKLDISALQLVMGVVEDVSSYVGNVESSMKTPAYTRHTEIVDFMNSRVKKHSRCGFLALPVGGKVLPHIDIGTYYKTKDRFHLSIYGEYDYTVGSTTVNIQPGTFFAFNNKTLHSAINTGNTTRITFVFDSPYENGKSVLCK